MAMIMKGGKVTVVVVENGAVGQRQLAEEMRSVKKDSKRIRQSRPVWRRSGTTAETSMHTMQSI